MRAVLHLYCLVLVSLAGCTRDLNPEAYLKWYERNAERFRMVVERAGFVIGVSFLPREYLAARELRGQDSGTLRKAEERYDRSLVFVVTCRRAADSEHSFPRETRLRGAKANARQPHFCLIAGSDTVGASTWQTDRLMATEAGLTYTIGFGLPGLKYDARRYTFSVRNVRPEVGTIEIPVRHLMRQGPRLKGKS